jgi:hypothetical protein
MPPTADLVTGLLAIPLVIFLFRKSSQGSRDHGYVERINMSDQTSFTSRHVGLAEVIPIHPGQLSMFNAEFGDRVEVRTSADPNEDQTFLHVVDVDSETEADLKLDPDTALNLGISLIEAAYSNVMVQQL